MESKNSVSFEIHYAKAAEKFFVKHENIRLQYELALKKLMTDDHPEEVDLKKIRGKRNDYYRIRLGGYRVIYTIINGKIVVINTILAGPRGDVYKKMSGQK